MTCCVLQQVCQIVLIFIIHPRAVVKRLLPQIVALSDTVDDLGDGSGVLPRYKIIFIGKIPVECRRRISAVVNDLLYRDLIDALYRRKLLKRSCEDLFCRFAFHITHL